jgi:hypothetical protein
MMAKDKNFKIDRNRKAPTIKASDVKIGDMFERHGSLHMRTGAPSHRTADGDAAFRPTTGDTIWVCNLNKGSVWQIDDTEQLTLVYGCEIKYYASEHQS